MRQALHILRKDIRALRYEIGVVLLLSVLRARGTEAWWVETPLILACAWLIARVIQTEPIPGDNQFWLTRPYRRWSLVSAKLVFIFLFVNLPLLIAQFVMLAHEGFSAGEYLRGLLYWLALMFLCVSLPIAAFATLTGGVVPLIIWALVLAIAVFMSWGAYLRLLWPMQVGWIPDTAALAAIVLTAGCVLYVQYRHRRTLFSRTFAGSSLALTAAGVWFLPWPVAMDLQSLLSKDPGAASGIHARVDPAAGLPYQRPARGGTVHIDVPVLVTGTPAGAEILGNAIAVTLTAGDRTWTTSNRPATGVNRETQPSGGVILRTAVLVDRSFFDAIGSQPVDLRASVYFTLFANERTRTLQLDGTPRRVFDGLHCNIGLFDYVYCRSPFRWPGELISVKVRDKEVNALTRVVSFSPLPAGLTLQAVESRWAPGPPPSRPVVTVIAREPVAHVRRDIEARGLRLVNRDLRLGTRPAPPR